MDTVHTHYDTSKPKATSELGASTNYESRYSSQDPLVNSKYDGFLRQPRYTSYRSNLMENFNAKEKLGLEEYTQSMYPTKDKIMTQSFGASLSS